MRPAVPDWRTLYLQALERRMAAQPAAVQARLQPQLEAQPGDAPATSPARQRAAGSPLAQLNAAVRSAHAARIAPAPGEPAPDPDELVNARRFRAAWERGRTLDEVERAIARKPAQAGPLNSHMLVLQSLAMMRDLSPAYLRRFVTHVETLQWLEQLGAVDTKDGAKGVKSQRRGRAAR